MLWKWPIRVVENFEVYDMRLSPMYEIDRRIFGVWFRVAETSNREKALEWAKQFSKSKGERTIYRTDCSHLNEGV